jgi:GT2 family glycosyltransferase
MISVIIVNWNGKHHLEVCLNSLYRQTFSDFEIILVDNGSQDGSVEFVRERYPKLRLVCLKENGGFARGNNEGLKVAKGEYIALLNNDTEVDPHWLGELHQAMKTHPEAGFAASKLINFFDRSKIDSAGDAFQRCGVGMKRGNLREAERYNEQELVFGACAGAAIYQKSMIEKIGFFDESFFCLYEDMDLSFRAQLQGYKCLYVPKAIVYHKVNSTLGAESAFAVYYGQRNLEYVYLKDLPFPLMVKCFPHHLLYNLLAFSFSLSKGSIGPFLKAKVDVFRTLSETLKKRRSIQRSRRVKESYIEAIVEKRWLKERILTKIQ